MLLKPYSSDLKPKMHAALYQVAQELSPGTPLFWYVAPTERHLVDALYISQNDLFPRLPENEPLNLLLDSPGGDIHAAYQLIATLRRRFDKLTIFVPRWAKSAATLVCLGSTKLVMTGIAELGPLDPQVRRPGQTAHRPALDDYRAFDALRRDTLQTLAVVMEFMVQRYEMDVDALLDPVTSFVANLMAPVYRNIDPITHGGHMRIMNVSQAYAERVLRQWGHPAHPPELVAEHLATWYPSHDFVLDYEEVRRLGLRAYKASEKEESAMVRLLPLLMSDHTLIGTIDRPPEASSTAGQHPEDGESVTVEVGDTETKRAEGPPDAADKDKGEAAQPGPSRGRRTRGAHRSGEAS